MKFTRLLVVLAALVSLSAVAATPAPAATVEECQGQLATLRADTEGTSFANAKSQTQLLTKLDDASTELALGKNADAVAKLVDFQTALTALAGAPKPKVDPLAAQGLVMEAQGVIDCINSVSVATRA